MLDGAEPERVRQMNTTIPIIVALLLLSAHQPAGSLVDPPITRIRPSAGIIVTRPVGSTEVWVGVERASVPRRQPAPSAGGGPCLPDQAGDIALAPGGRLYACIAGPAGYSWWYAQLVATAAGAPSRRR